MTPKELEDIKKYIYFYLEKKGLPITHIHITLKMEHIISIQVYSQKNIKNENFFFFLKKKIQKKIEEILEKTIIVELEINNFMKKREEKLFEYIDRKIEKVKQKGVKVILPYYNPYIRKKIHEYILSKGEKDIYSKSFGEGKNRRIHICKLSGNMTIDKEGIFI